MAAPAIERVRYQGKPYILLEGRGFRPLGEVLEQKNRIFYSIPWGFLPFDTSDTQENFTISANANNFRSNVSDPNGAFYGRDRLTAHFWGIGYGEAHCSFSEFMQRKDGREGTDYFSRLNLVLGDFSQEILRANTQEGQGFQAVRFDASQSLPFKDGSADYIRFNELYDDLPGVEFIAKRGNNFCRLLGRPALDTEHGIETCDGGPISPEEFVLDWWPGGIEKLKGLRPSFLYSVGYQEATERLWQPRKHPAFRFLDNNFRGIDEITVPLNWGAKRNLDEALRILRPGGYLEFFDYGFFDPQFLIDHRSDIVRTIMGQPTVVVNFPFLLADIDSNRFDVTTETQSQYLSRNFPLTFIPATWFLTNSENVSALLPGGGDLEESAMHGVEPMSLINSLASGKMWMTSLDVEAVLRTLGFKEASIQETIAAMFQAHNSTPDGGLYHVLIRKR